MLRSVVSSGSQNCGCSFFVILCCKRRKADYFEQTTSISVNKKKSTKNTSQQDFGTRKVYCVSNVTFHAESKYAIKIFPSPTVFVQWRF